MSFRIRYDSGHIEAHKTQVAKNLKESEHANEQKLYTKVPFGVIEE